MRAGPRSTGEDGNRGSCCAPVWLRWRAKQELRGGETFYYVHGGTAYRAAPERMSVVSRRRCRRSGCLPRASEQIEAEGQQSGPSSVGEESEVADAHEGGRQHMQQKPAQELIDFKSHGPLLVAMRGISPAEGDVAISESD